MLPSEAEEAGFWSAIAEAPQDEVPRLIFADWLEERNDPRGPLLRERQYWRHLNADCRDPVQVVLGVLDARPTGPSRRTPRASPSMATWPRSSSRPSPTPSAGAATSASTTAA